MEPAPSPDDFGFEVAKRLDSGGAAGSGGRPLGRAGTIRTPHGEIQTPAFIPVVATPAPAMLTPPSAPAAPLAIEVQLQRGALQARVSWPVQAAGECAAWLRELFR